jgi:hypothetical protein
MVRNKRSDNPALRIRWNLIHSLIHALAAYVAVMDWTCWCIPAAVLVSHFIIDFFYKGNKQGMRAFVTDQGLHVLVAAALWLLYTGQVGAMGEKLSLMVENNTIWYILLAYILVLHPASRLVYTFIQKWEKQLFAGNKEIPEKKKGLENAGLWIGYIERILILTFIFAGSIEAIGFLLAAKSIFRYGDLKEIQEVKMTEYVLIGTLASFSAAILIGVSVKYCLL